MTRLPYRTVLLSPGTAGPDSVDYYTGAVGRSPHFAWVWKFPLSFTHPPREASRTGILLSQAR